MNKRTYNKQIATLTATLDDIRTRIAAGDCRNEMHDAEADTLQAIRDAEFARDTRNWTRADHTTHGLICSNVD